MRSFQVLVDGRIVRTWDAAVRALTATDDSGLVYSSFGRGTVLPAGARRTLLQLPRGAQATAFWVGAQERLVTVVCYYSIYDECWRSDDRDDQPPPVHACPTDSASKFRR